MRREQVRRKLLFARAKRFITLQEVIELQWESFFREIKTMLDWYDGLIPKKEYEDYLQGKIEYPIMQPKEVPR